MISIATLTLPAPPPPPPLPAGCAARAVLDTAPPCLDSAEPAGAPLDSVEPAGALFDSVEPAGALFDPVESGGAPTTDSVEPPGAPTDPVEPAGAAPKGAVDASSAGAPPLLHARVCPAGARCARRVAAASSEASQCDRRALARHFACARGATADAAAAVSRGIGGGSAVHTTTRAADFVPPATRSSFVRLAQPARPSRARASALATRFANLRCGMTSVCVRVRRISMRVPHNRTRHRPTRSLSHASRLSRSTCLHQKGIATRATQRRCGAPNPAETSALRTASTSAVSVLLRAADTNSLISVIRASKNQVRGRGEGPAGPREELISSGISHADKRARALPQRRSPKFSGNPFLIRRTQNAPGPAEPANRQTFRMHTSGRKAVERSFSNKLKLLLQFELTSYCSTRVSNSTELSCLP